VAGWVCRPRLHAAREGSIGLSLGLVPHADIGVGPRVEGGGIGDRVGGLVEGGGEDPEFDALFTVDRPAIFAYHGYPTLIHRLTYRRHGHDNLHVRGYKEEGTTTTPFGMVMLNDLDRFHLVMDVIDRVPGLLAAAGHLRQLMWTSGSRPGPTPANSARTHRRSATGSGRTDRRRRRSWPVTW